MNDSPDPTKIRNFLLVWLETSFCLLNVPYHAPLEMDPDMLSALLRAIQYMMNDGIRKIKKKQSTYLFEINKDLLFVLIMQSVPDEDIYRQALVKIKEEVSSKFQNRPEWPRLVKTGRIGMICECEIDVVPILPLMSIDRQLTPEFRSRREDIPFDIGEFSDMLDLVCGFIDGKKTVAQIVDTIPIDVNLVRGLLSVLLAYDWIELIRVPSLGDTLTLVKEPTESDLNSFLPSRRVKELIHDFNGEFPINQIADNHKMNPSVVLFIARQLLERGILSFAA